MKISLFKNSYNKKPVDDIDFEEFIYRIIEGYWKKSITTLRDKRTESEYKRAKLYLPAVTMSATFNTLERAVSWEKRIRKHSGLICLDIDKKDNPKLKPGHLIDNGCLAQFVSPSGEGVKIVYQCARTLDPAEHRRIYDAAVQRLEDKGVTLKIDPVVKSIASLQFVSYDPQAYYIPKTKIIIQPLPPKKQSKKKAPSEDVAKDLEQLSEYIECLGEKDITSSYDDWLTIAFGLAYSLGEFGRDPFHAISRNYAGYNEDEANEKFDSILEQDQSNVARPVTIASVIQLVQDNIPKVKLRHLRKKYNKSHAIGKGEDTGEENGDLAGMVRYKLFLFKKIYDKEKMEIVELIPHSLNLNEFEKLLREKQFYRHEDKFVHIIDNIVHEADANDVLRIITEHIEREGNYTFTYKKMEYLFNWEELALLWRGIRANAGMTSQLKSSLTRWVPNLLQDTLDVSYVPYLNCVVEVTRDGINTLTYDKLKQQIWNERIIPRNYKHIKRPGMFQEFFANVCGRGKNMDARLQSESFKRSLWYFGYMMQGAKRKSIARAWLLYDTKPGNNGRTGKTILGHALGKVRSMAMLDGKHLDFKNRFAFQTVQPWTDIVFIDDPSRYMSLGPLFNMITGELHAEKKGMNPIVRSVKFVIASNFILETDGTSEIGRQFVTQLSDFYVKYGERNNNTITPIVDYHGKEFFTDWDEYDWNQFDSFCMRALKYHLVEASPDNIIIGNSKYVRFLQLYEDELFHHLALALIENIRYTADKENTYVPQSVMMEVINNSSREVGKHSGGKIVREFFKAIGVSEIGITTVRVNSLNRSVYRLDIDYPEMYFGKFELPKPNY